MESLLKQETAQKFIDRINKLTPQSQAQWGKMNVNQMVKHCQTPLNIASGALKIKVNPIIRFLFGKNARKQILNEPEFKKNLPTFNEAKITGSPELEAEKKKLIDLIERFQKGGSEKIIKEEHPFFGPLTIEEWDAMQTKHLDHHLRQFGV